MLNARHGSEHRCDLNTYRPLLETLEPRLPPGDALLGLLLPGGLFDLPFSDSSLILRPSSLPSDSSFIVPRSSFAGVPAAKSDAETMANSTEFVATWPRSDVAVSRYVPDLSPHLAESVAPWPMVSRPMSGSAVEGHAPGQASFPNSSSGTPVRETPFRRPAEDETEFPGLAFPNGSSGTRDMQAAADKPFGSVPFYFEQNMGQADPSFDFVARGSGYTLGLSATEAVMALPIPDNRVSPMELDRLPPEERAKLDPTGRPFDVPPVADAPGSPEQLRMQIVGADPQGRAAGVNPLVTKINYFIGNDPNQWHTNVPTFGKVQYEEVYPGIDLVYYGQGRDLEYDFVVSPGANPNQIALSFSGADSIELDDAGNLVLHVGDNQIVQNAPYLYQDINGGRKEVAGSFVLSTGYSGFVTFDIGDYDATRPLVIDPVVVAFSTYLGGPGADRVYDLAADPTGSVVVTGNAKSGFPVVNPLFNYGGSDDAFVAKFSADGATLLYSTYLGGSYYDKAYGIAVDGKGAAYITGVSESSNFPTTPGAFDTLSVCNGEVPAPMHL